MATIRKHRDKYQVQVRRKGFPPVSRSFHKLADAKEWARHIETQADRQELAPNRKELGSITLGDLIRRYRDEVVPTKKGANIETIILDAFLRHRICKKTLSPLNVRLRQLPRRTAQDHHSEVRQAPTLADQQPV